MHHLFELKPALSLSRSGSRERITDDISFFGGDDDDDNTDECQQKLTATVLMRSGNQSVLLHLLASDRFPFIFASLSGSLVPKPGPAR